MFMVGRRYQLSVGRWDNMAALRLQMLLLCVSLAGGSAVPGRPHVSSLTLLEHSFHPVAEDRFRRQLLLRLTGRGFSPGLQAKLTRRHCEDPEARPGDLHWLNESVAVVELDVVTSRAATTLHTCLAPVGTPPASPVPDEVIKWKNQGPSGTLRLDPLPNRRARRSEVGSLYGLSVVRSSSSWHLDDQGVPHLLMLSSATLRLFGHDLAGLVTLTDRPGPAGAPCEYPVGHPTQVKLEGNVGDVEMQLPDATESGLSYYFCYKFSNDSVWIHLGSGAEQHLILFKKLLPAWASIVIIMVCLVFSSLFSGLNLGLMSLDQTDLKIINNTGTDKEKKYAKAILPIRKHGNYLLCSILLGNVMVNSTFTILLDDLTSGLVAIIASTLLIVVFGEITPQAICSRHGLAVGARTILITKLVMGLTSPLSYPISKILDRVLGEEIGAVFTRERLKELVKLNTGTNIKTDELNIISGVLELTEKKVCDVMTKIEDVFMLSIDAVLDFTTVSSIMKSGFSRIPVFEGNRTNIVTVLYIKDLALVDPDDNLPIKTVCEFYQNNCFFIFEDTPLDYIFRQFKEGSKGHMAFVHRVNNEGEGDPFYETVGIVTLEDVIEELIQAEIVDETDVYTDNKSKRRRQQQKYKDFSEFAELSEGQRVHISPQLTLATFQYLSTTLEPFRLEHISEVVLKRVLKQDVFRHVKIKNEDNIKKDPATLIYDQGKPADFFVLVLEGRVSVTVGRESLVFESGPFSHFGLQALSPTIGIESPSGGGGLGGGSAVGSLQSVVQAGDSRSPRQTFVPDYTVRASTEVFYLKLPRSLYMAARRATLMQQARRVGDEHQPYDDVFEKLIHTYEGDDSKSQGTPEVTRTSSQMSARGSPLNNGGVLTVSEPVLLVGAGSRELEESSKLLSNS